MGWGELRRQIWNRQNGLCSVCHEPVSLSACVIHHIRNKSQKGKESLSNGTARHRDCETWCHENFRYGNPNHTDNYDCRERPYYGKKSKKGRNPRDYWNEQRVWRYYCRTGRLPNV